MKKKILIIIITVLVIAGLGIIWQLKNKGSVKVSGENIGNELEKQDLIRLTNPQPNDIIKSPLVITGEARGNWFFEGQFPVELRIPSKPPQAVVAKGIARAQSEWTTNEFVPFEATLTFENPTGGFDEVLNPEHSLILELKKDNPSGLSQNDNSLDITVILKK